MADGITATARLSSKKREAPPVSLLPGAAMTNDGGAGVTSSVEITWLHGKVCSNFQHVKVFRKKKTREGLPKQKQKTAGDHEHERRGGSANSSVLFRDHVQILTTRFIPDDLD